MLADLPFDIDFSNWRQWIVPAVGVGSALLALVVGWILVGGRSKAKPSAAQDPFDPAHKLSFYVPSEKRKAPRRRGGSVEVFISDADAKSEPFKGVIVDRSTGGLRLLIDRQIKPATILSVRSCQAMDMVPWVQVQVKSCRPDGKTWEVGCQFLLTPPWNVMLLFG